MRILIFLKILVASIAFFAIPIILNAQTYAPISTIANVNKCAYSLIQVPITVTNFSNIGAITLRIEYDSTVLRFERLISHLNSPLTGGQFNSDTVGSSGTIRKVLISASFFPGVSLSDGSTMATLAFILKSGSATLTFNNTINSGHSCEYALFNPPTTLSDVPTSTYYINGIVSSNGTTNPNWGCVTTGGSVINPGQSTGTLTTTGFTGSILRWQRQLNGKGFANIPGTAGLTNFSETLLCTGIYEYRCVVLGPTCDSTVSIPTTVAVVVANGGSKTWVGTYGNDFSNPNNWNPCGTPDLLDNLLIPSSVTYMPVVLSAGQACNNVTVQNGASLTVNPGIKLSISGTFTLEP